MKRSNSASVLIYTLVLVVLAILMALGVLNLAQKLSLDYDSRLLDNSLSSHIRAKKDLLVKYSRYLNTNGSGFVDTISCPSSITMSGTSFGPKTISTEYVYTGGIMSCRGSYLGANVDIYFNSGFTDTYFLEYNGSQIVLNASSPSGTLYDSDQTYVDAHSSYPLGPDLIDDNFNSDNYNISSTGAESYASGYIDDDAQMRMEYFGYIVQGSPWYNTLWINDDVRDMISKNSNNSGSIYEPIGNVYSGSLYLDIDRPFRLRLYTLHKQNYSDFNELKIMKLDENSITLDAEKGYLQSDLTLSPQRTGNEYDFDFTQNDYALFIQNYGSGTMLYRIGVRNSDNTPVYSVPLKDDEPGFLTYLGSHIILDASQRLITKISKLVSFK